MKSTAAASRSGPSACTRADRRRTSWIGQVPSSFDASSRRRCQALLGNDASDAGPLPHLHGSLRLPGVSVRPEGQVRFVLARCRSATADPLKVSLDSIEFYPTQEDILRTRMTRASAILCKPPSHFSSFGCVTSGAFRMSLPDEQELVANSAQCDKPQLSEVVAHLWGFMREWTGWTSTTVACSRDDGCRVSSPEACG